MNKLIKSVNDILKLEEQIKEIKKTIQSKKLKLNEIALENKETMTVEYIAHLKYELEFPVAHFTSFNTRVKILLPVHCECGAEKMVKINSKSSYDNFKKEKNKYQCEKCTAKFWVNSDINQKKRENELKELKTMPYKEYLQTFHWKEFRKKVLKRYSCKCQLCGHGGELNVHHNNYAHRGEEDYKDVLLLCKICHSKFHNKEVV